MAEDRGYTIGELWAELRRFEAELKTAGLRPATTWTYVTKSDLLALADRRLQAGLGQCAAALEGTPSRPSDGMSRSYRVGRPSLAGAGARSAVVPSPDARGASRRSALARQILVLPEDRELESTGERSLETARWLVGRMTMRVKEIGLEDRVSTSTGSDPTS